MDNFIPKAEAEKVKGRALFDEETNKWTLTPLGAKYEHPNAVFTTHCSFSRSGSHVPRPVSRIGSLRPTSGCAKMAAASGNPRYLVRVCVCEREIELNSTTSQ